MRSQSGITDNKQLCELSEMAAIVMIQGKVNGWLKDEGKPDVRIIGIQKTNRMIKLKCGMAEDATHLTELDWTALKGATVAKKTYGIVAH